MGDRIPLNASGPPIAVRKSIEYPGHFFNMRIKTEGLRTLPRCCGNAPAERRILQKEKKGLGNRLGLVFGHEDPVLKVSNDFRDAAGPGGDHGNAAGHGFDDHASEGFIDRG
jgi:hypothetical protein